jgi:hypothetical protein
MSKVLGIDWLNYNSPSTIVDGDGCNNIIESTDDMYFSGTVLLPELAQQRPMLIDYHRPRRWNSGDNFGKDVTNARVPAWALLEMTKQKSLSPSWQYSRSTGENSVSCRDIARLLYQKSILKEQKEELTVLAIPELVSSFGQENLIRAFPGSRNNLRLLWRSVAAILGLPSEHYSQLEPGKRIAVFDFQPHRLEITKLDFKNDERGGVSMVVPVRHLPKQDYFRSTALPPLEFYHAEALLTEHGVDYDECSIWYLAMTLGLTRHEIDNNDLLLFPLRNGVWDELIEYKTDNLLDSSNFEHCVWQKRCEELLKLTGSESDDYSAFLHPGRSSQFLWELKQEEWLDFDYAILCGPYLQYLNHEHLKDQLHCDKVYREGIDTAEHLISRGCGIFGTRALAEIPTYFDQLPSLELVVQDSENEDIKTDVLIEGTEWPGNEEFSLKEALTGYFIDKDNSFCEFFLQMEGEDKLRELKQHFAVKLDERADIKLYPSMRPAQGMAQVEVRNSEIFQEPVLLDWEKMEESEKTIQILRDSIERSFPPYFPGVKANNWKWEDVKWNIAAYAHDGRDLSKGCLNTMGGIGMDHDDDTGLGRINVFGCDPDYAIATRADQNLVTDFFDELLSDYRSMINYNDTIRAIAWTYNSKKFKEVRTNLVNLLNNGTKLKTQEQTACANLFCTSKEYQAYFSRVLKEFDIHSTTSMNGYVNCLKKMLSYRNDVLSYIDSEDCCLMLEYLLDLLISGFNNSQEIIFNNALITMLFMLKRRRYDRQFIPYCGTDEGNNLLLNKIIDVMGQIMDQSNNDFYRHKMLMTTDGTVNLLDEILKFMKGKGSLVGGVFKDSF